MRKLPHKPPAVEGHATPVDEWIEVNIVPADKGSPERLLLDIVDPIVHEQLGDEIERWFYFWEPELRLRLRWRDPNRADSNRSAVAQLLDQAQAEGRLARWWEGNHGKEGERYTGEAEFYGPELWELTSRDWMGGSELALAIVKLDSEGRLSKPRDFHWERRVHLFSNQLLADEIALCLRQAHGYIGTRFRGDPRFDDVMNAIEKLFRP